MRVVTWNVNSIRAREERLLAMLERHRPDVVCLQETKVEDDHFPFEGIGAAGYHAVVNGQRTYNGVAILAREEPSDVRRGFGGGMDDGQARLMEARVGGIRVASVYVPNGGIVGSDKWTYKLGWMARFSKWLEHNASPEEPLLLCGDFNVAPDERDVENPFHWSRTVLFHPDAREALASIMRWGLFDALRLQTRDRGLYTWWDYRRLSFPKNDGLRIDHVFLTRPLADRCTAVAIDRDERKGERPSDHVPVIAELDLTAC